jgi:hypothetical protein
MVDVKFSRLANLAGMMKDMGDGTHAEVIAAVIYNPATGQIQVANANGRTTAANSAPVTLSVEDKASLDAASEVYTNVALYSGVTTAGKAVLLVCSVAGTATLTFAGGGSVIIPVEAGLSLLPFALTNAAQTTGTMSIYKLS